MSLNLKKGKKIIGFGLILFGVLLPIFVAVILVVLNPILHCKL
jgi:hypothetical protein